MKLIAELKINGNKIASMEMYRDKYTKNKFICRKWVNGLKLCDNEKVKLAIIDSTGKHLSDLSLKATRQHERLIYTLKEDDGIIYSWGTVTEGYGRSFAITAGILFRRKRQEVPSIDITAKDFLAGDGI